MRWFVWRKRKREKMFGPLSSPAVSRLLQWLLDDFFLFSFFLMSKFRAHSGKQIKRRKRGWKKSEGKEEKGSREWRGEKINQVRVREAGGRRQDGVGKMRWKWDTSRNSIEANQEARVLIVRRPHSAGLLPQRSPWKPFRTLSNTAPLGRHACLSYPRHPAGAPADCRAQAAAFRLPLNRE